MSRTLDHLLDRNVRWAAARTRTDPDYFRRMAEQQTPHFLWIGCSDSRITANDVLDLEPGEVFVHRNIANTVHTSDMNLLSVLEFAVVQLCVEHIIVCGHYGCSGVARAMGHHSQSMLDHWLQPLAMLHRRFHAHFQAMASDIARLDHLCALNVEMQVRRLAATPIVEAAWARGQSLHLHGWIYAIEDGLLRDLGPHLSSNAERDGLVSIEDRVIAPAEAISARRRQAEDAFRATCDDEVMVCAEAKP